MCVANLVVGVCEVAHDDGHQVSGEGCGEVGPILV